MAENQEQSKPKEREIPVFTVLKNNCILKNIFLLDNPPSIPSSPPSVPVSENVDQAPEIEEVLVVGRHPDCNIKLEHPSISRFHLRIHTKPSSRSLYVTDLSSVHGTWISGKKIEPGVQMKLDDGESLQLGASSRLYRLSWVPLSCAYDIDNPFVPQLDAADTVDEETDEPIDQDKNILFDKNDQANSVSANLEGLEQLSFNEDMNLSVQKTSPATFTEDDWENNKENGSPSVDHLEASELLRMNSDDWENDKENGSPSVDHLEASELLGMNSDDSENDKENGSPSVDHLEASELLGMNSDKKSDSLSIWLRRSKGDQIETSLLRVHSARMKMGPQVKKLFLDENHESEASVLSDNLKGLERLFSNVDSNSSMQKMSPSVDHLEASEILGMNSDKKSGSLSIWSRRGKCESVQIETSRFRVNSARKKTGPQVKKLFLDENHASESVLKFPEYKEEFFTPDKENASPVSILFRSLTSENEGKSNNEPILCTPISSSADQDEETFTPDKENMTPNSRLFRSEKNAAVKNSSSYRSSPLKMVHNSNMCQDEAIEYRKVFQELKSASSGSKMHGSSKKEMAMLKGRANRVPFRPLPVNSPSDSNAESKPSVCQNNTTKMAENRWIIVVDTACLLNKKSRNELQLLRGLRGTTLVIPRIVVRELDCMLRRGGLFTRKSEVSAALQFIEECMAVAKWWVHVQSSAEEGRLVPPTPPATSSPRWLGEDMWASSVGSSAPFSPCSLQEIVTPTAADHILDYALYYKRIRKDGQLVLLSDDVTLKIKAMAEGVLCETAQEFRRSLVNPFSARFLYSNCSPIGPTWSCEDDTVLKEKYYPSPLKKIVTKSGEGGGVKGLKLILKHNSSFRQIKPVS